MGQGSESLGRSSGKDRSHLCLPCAFQSQHGNLGATREGFLKLIQPAPLFFFFFINFFCFFIFFLCALVFCVHVCLCEGVGSLELELQL